MQHKHKTFHNYRHKDFQHGELQGPTHLQQQLIKWMVEEMTLIIIVFDRMYYRESYLQRMWNYIVSMSPIYVAARLVRTNTFCLQETKRNTKRHGK